MHRNHRIKIEFLPALMNLPFAAIFIYILFSEQIYWNMFNSLLAGYLGNLQWNWIYILMGLIFGIIAYSVIIILLGMIRIGFLHNRVLNIIPTIFLAIMVVVLIALVNIDTRINLGYLFFLLGPQPGIEAYIGGTLGVLGLIGLEILGIKQLMQEIRFRTINPKKSQKQCDFAKFIRDLRQLQQLSRVYWDIVFYYQSGFIILKPKFTGRIFLPFLIDISIC